MNEVQIPLKLTGIGAMKAELKALKGAIATASDPAQMEALAKKAGEVADRIKDANEQVAVFTAGSKFESVSNSFSAIQGDLASLDFEGAAEKSQVFANSLGKIGKADISGAIKGITGTIKTLGGAFVKLGIQILTNPMFLLVGVITAIVVGIGVFLAKIGVLQKAFSVLMAPINAIIDGFKRMTDWLGLTQYAAEENAKKVSKANDAASESSKKRADKVADAYDIEIAKAKASGKDVTDLEIAKSKAISKEAETRYKDAQKEYAALQKIASKDNLERRKKLREQMEAEKKILSDGRKDRQLLEIEDAKEQADRAKANAEKRRENAKAYAKNRLDAERTIKDIEISLIKNDDERELATLNEKYARLIEDVKKNETLTGQEKVRLTALYESQKLAEIDKAAQAQKDEEAKREANIQKAITENQNAQLQKEEEFQEQFRQLTMTDQERELDEVQTRYFELIALAEQYGLDANLLLEQQRAEEFEINKKYDDMQKEAEEKAAEDAKKAHQEKVDRIMDYAQAFSSAMTGLNEVLNASDEQRLKKAAGNVALEERIKKKMFERDKKLRIAQTIIDTASNVIKSVRDNGGVPYGIPFGIIAGAMGAFQIAAISKTKFEGGGGSVSVGSTGSASAEPAVPQLNLIGQGNNLNTATQPQAVATNQSMVVQAVVSETDITNTQNKIDKIKKGSEL
jgi:hypothetical protein